MSEDIEAVWACAEAVPPEQLPSALRDNVYGHCSLCGRAIMWRPYAIAEAEKTCLKCVKVLSDAFTEIGEAPEVVVVDKARDEFSTLYGEKLTIEAIRRVDRMFRKPDD